MTNPSNYIDGLEIFSGQTRDQIIIIRDALKEFRTTDAKELSVELAGKDWSLNIRARR